MEIGHVEGAPGLEVAGDDTRPPLHVVEPAQDPVAGEDDVELPVEMLGQIVDVAADEIRARARR
jgi:hypothetical protein